MVGFEGGSHLFSPISYGCAALYVDGKILNPMSGARISPADFMELAVEGHVTLLQLAHGLPDGVEGNYLLQADREGAVGAIILQVHTENPVAVDVWPSGNYRYFFFKDYDKTFEAFAEKAAARLRAFSEEPYIQRAAATLDPKGVDWGSL